MNALPGAWAQQIPAATGAAAMHDYDLKPGPLARTLDEIARISGRPIVFDGADLAGASAVNGKLDAEAAIRQALAGTKHELIVDGMGTLVVTRSTRVEIVAKRDQAETEFKADRSDTSTRSGTSLHLVPGSVTLITSKVLESQQATDLTEALRNVSGMSFNKTPQSTTTFGIRGFSASSDSNGITDNSATSRSVFAVERVEVLKGPQAILSGGDSLGGAVNVVVKKPQAETIRDLTLQYGSFDDKTVAGDLSGAISEDKRFTYRTVASVQDARRNEVGMNGKNAKSFMQALRWKDNATDFIISAEYNNDKVPLERYTLARRDGVILPTPQRLLANPSDGVDTRVRRFGYQLERKIGDNIVLISRVQDTHQDLDLRIPSPSGLLYAKGAAPDSPRPDIELYGERMMRTEDTLSGDHYLRFNVPTGELRHKLSVGFNHTNFDQTQTQYGSDALTIQLYPLTPPPEIPSVRDRTTGKSSGFVNGQRQRAIYVQDLISYEKWNLLLNLRRNRYATPEGTTTYYATPDNFLYHDPESTTYHTTPGVGLVYQLNDQTSLYGSFAQGFQPSTALACGGGGFVPPNLTTNREVGAKFDLLDSRFTLTTSAFSLQQSNRLQYDLINDCYNVRKAQRTEGVEVDAQGRLLPGLEAIFNYTYTKIKDTGDATTLFPGQPKHKANLWAVYKFQRADLKGLGVGVGVSANSSSLGSPYLPFMVPGGAQVDASLYYTSGRWNATLGVKNVLDRTLYGTTSAETFVPVLPGRVYALTVKRSFQ
ncbi:TonB-dependent receptor [Duganella sp. BJB1802]|uniref:TonB-dependent siderophore receptor n=1 Tax=Duganella sp. BJB1802 TaxID=2744575 RepID=UPI001593FA36|nr:TonB-dependent receptor [Duganella sp. BJB1802]NVD71002.1 TonB-dependent receptor [Duganella sp. BJB1802]